MRFSLQIVSIDGMDPCVVGIKVQLPRPKVDRTQIVHFHLVLHLAHFDAIKSVLSVEKSAAGQQITLNRSLMTQKRSLVTVTLSIRPDQVMNKIYIAGSPSMKLLTMIKV